jgi:hypothetical protein
MGISSLLDSLAEGRHSFSVELVELADKLGVSQAQAFSLVSGAFSTWDCEERHLNGEAWADFLDAVSEGRKGLEITLVRSAGTCSVVHPEKHEGEPKATVKRRSQK